MAEAISSDYDEMELSKAVKLISEKAQDVIINKENIKKKAEEVMTFMMERSTYFYMYNNRLARPLSYPKEKHGKKADWLFVLHTLNFSLWYPKTTTQWKVAGTMGYHGLCNAIERADNEGTPMWQPKYYSKITRSDFERIFQSDDGKTCIPLIDERIKILHEVGEILYNKYQGTFDKCIQKTGYDADKLIKLVLDEFQSYRDEVVYDVCFLHKARTLVSDIWIYYRMKPKFNLNTKHMMSTLFIEYPIPQLFLDCKLLRYSDKLAKRFQNSNEPLEHGSREEIEIRGCILFIVKEICKEVHKISPRYTKELPIMKSKACNIPVIVDNFFLTDIFLAIKTEPFTYFPLHYIRTVHY